MLVKRKVWVGVSLVAGIGAAVAAQDAAGDFPGGKFSDALKKVLAGEGGEGGMGMSKLRNGSVTIPALTGAQLKEALSGNTLRRDNAGALHFAPQGSFKGWEVKWEKVDSSLCAKGESPGYDLDDGVCWHSETVQQKGTWTIQGNKLCTEPTLFTIAGRNKCVTLVLVLDRFGVFNDKGEMLGKGNTLVPGEQLDKSPKGR